MVRSIKVKNSKLSESKQIKYIPNIAQTIFKMKIRMEEVKIIFRWKDENLECKVFKELEESHKHILECREITKMNKNKGKPPDYENLL